MSGKRQRSGSPAPNTIQPPSARRGLSSQGEPAAPSGVPPERSSSFRRDLVVLAVLAAATFLAYQPAWFGTLLWDDAQHVTQPALRTLNGLWRIWFEPGATQQYYPLVHSAFWLEHRLWGQATLGYHLVNVALHACTAWLVFLILRKLKVPGAWLAAAVFALHPVQVESVAWITELKNTLSGALGLSAVLVYLGFDESRRRRRYALAMALFVLALLAKTVTAMLPVMVLAALWWKRGSLSWRRDVLPAAPFLAVGAAAGLATALIERTVIGAQGAAYNFTLVERCLIAGRATWFYLLTLAWPSRLVFIYPRWNVSQQVWWQYLFPAGAIALVAGAWAIRSRSRAPLAALLALLAALFPVLGFFNVYPFRFSFVADHFVYLAGIPVFALFAAGLTRVARSLPARAPRLAVSRAASLVLLGVLAALSFQQSRKYANATVLYESTLRDNPSCWLADINLGKAIAEGGPGDLEDAVRYFKAALAIKPDLQEAHYNLGLAYQRMGRPADAVASYEVSLAEGPDLADTRVNLCAALRSMGRLQEAMASCRRAVELAPDSADARFGLGLTLETAGHLQDALGALAEAARLEPSQAEIFNEMGNVLQGLARWDEAASAYREALRLRPAFPRSLAGLGFVLAQQGQLNEAVGLYEQALRLAPDYVDARYYLGTALQSMGRLEEAVEEYRKVLAVSPSDAAAHNNIGLALEQLGRPEEAAAHYREALRLRPDMQQAAENLNRVLRNSR
jgi:tetratricopeptide (TPR) repeat protein